MSAHSITSRGLAGRKIPQGTLTPMGTLLFSASEPGAWYDPSDMSTLFQDAAGTTPVTAVEQPVGRMLDKSGRGNHATQATTTKRPVLSRRVNLFSATESPSADSWVTVLANVAGLTVTPTTSFGQHYIYSTPSLAVPGSAVVRFTARANGYTRIMLREGSVTGNMVLFDLIAGTVVNTQVYTGSITASVDLPGWFDCTVNLTGKSQTGEVLAITVGNSSTTNWESAAFAGDGVSGVDVTRLQFVRAADAHLPYQRVNTATDYDADPAKFPAYRRLDGVDDSHASATGGGGTAGFFFSASVSPQGGAGTARTLFSDAGTNTGYIVRLNASNQLELAAGNGTAYTTIATAGTLAVNTTDVVQAWDDGTNLNVKIGNGATASVARPAVSAGTAGYTMGQDNGASTGYFNGRMYSTIYRKDSGLTQVQRESVALHQRQKARMP